MNVPRARLAAVALLLAAAAAPAIERPRQEGVVYVEDFLAEPYTLRTLRATPLAFGYDGGSVIDWLVEKQRVTIIGLGSERHLVRAVISNGRAEGWVLAADIEPPSPAMLAEFEKKRKEADRIRQAIARGEIEVGMPQDAVTKILGKPTSKSSVREAGGDFEQWTYTTYKTIPYYAPTTINGTNVVSTFYRRVPVGTKIVTFQAKQVIRVEQKEEPINPNAPGGGIVVPPIIIQ